MKNVGYYESSLLAVLNLTMKSLSLYTFSTYELEKPSLINLQLSFGVERN